MTDKAPVAGKPRATKPRSPKPKLPTPKTPVRKAQRISGAEMKAIEKQLYTRSFYHFILRAWQEIDPAPIKDNWHLQVLADHLQAVTDGRIKRLLINICPGSGKSNIVNVLFPAWVWTHSPEKRIISTSHKEKLAIRDSTKTRRLVESDWYQSFWAINLRDDQNAKAAFENDRFGAREASPMSSITGSRGNIVIVDDPHSVDDAKSDAYRETAVDTFFQTISNRINDPSRDAIICVMQRLHAEDVSGMILEKQVGYDHLCIPLLADGVDRPATSIGWKDHRAEGENMFPEHYTPEFVEMPKAVLGPFAFSGQYQQNPIPTSDGFLKEEWFDRYKPEQLPAYMHYYMTSDHAPSGSTKGDYNVFRMWGVDCNRNLWLVDSFRRKCTMDIAIGIERDPKSGKAILAREGALAMIRKWKPLAWFPEADNTWSAIRSLVEAAMLETNTFCHVETLPTKGSGDKVGKCQPYQAMASMGLIHLPVGQVGDDAILEYVSFPVGKHDDQVDADGAIARVISQAHGAFVAPADDTPDDFENEFRRTPRQMSASDACWG